MRLPLPDLPNFFLQTEKHHEVKSCILRHPSTTHNWRQRAEPFRTCALPHARLAGWVPALLQQLSGHLSMVLGWSQKTLLRAAAEDVSAEHISFCTKLYECSCGSRTSFVQAAQSTCKKIPKHVLAQVSTCLCTGHNRFSIFKVKSGVQLQPHHLGDRNQPDPKSPQRNSSFSVGSIVLWIWLVTPVSPRSLVLSFHSQSLFSLVSQNCPEQLKQVNYLKCCSCLKIYYGLSTDFNPSTWSIACSGQQDSRVTTPEGQSLADAKHQRFIYSSSAIVINTS